MKKIILVFTLTLIGISAFTQNAPIAKTNTQGIANLKVPDFKDARAKAYYNWYKNYVQKYLQAVL